MLSASALGYEVLLMRLFSIIQWHHFAYMIISVALLGYGAAGTLVTLLRGPLERRFTSVFAACAALFGTTAVSGFLLAEQVQFNPLEFAWTGAQALRLLLIYLLLLIPFLFAAMCLCLTFTRYGNIAHRVYSFDIVGAGLGGLGVIAALYWLTPMGTLIGIALAGFSAAALVWLADSERSRKVAVSILMAGVLLVAALPASWMELRLSEYKDLAQTLQIVGTRVVAEASSPLGQIAVVESPIIPFRHAPGLSLNAPSEPPPQLGIFTDGNGLMAINRDDGQRDSLAYLDFLTAAAPYHLINRPRVLVLGAGGGSEILQSLYHNVREVDAVELNPQVIHIVEDTFGDFSGRPFSKPNVRIHAGEARGFIARTTERYDLIQLALLDAFGASSAGLYALAESYLYTVEAFHDYMSRLAPGGVLAITRWVTLPPRDTLKLFATAVSALEKEGVRDPGKRLALIRGWKTATLLIKNGELSAGDVANLKAFCRERSFDVAYYPGMSSEESEVFNKLDQPYFWDGITALLGQNRDSFVERYKFHIVPATDDRPYFFQFFKWRTLPELWRLHDRGGISLLEWGYPLLVASLVQATAAGLALIVLPLWYTRGRLIGDPGRLVSLGRVGVYFTAVGLAFMFIEIAFIQKFILFLHHPLYAVSVVLCAFLVFAGIGSRFCGRFGAAAGPHVIRRIVLAIWSIAAAYLVFLPGLFHQLTALPDVPKIAFSVALIAPLAFCMGMPFPMALSAIANRNPACTPWAWGINACASVVSANLATLLAIHFGFTWVVLCALAFYGFAAAQFPRERAESLQVDIV